MCVRWLWLAVALAAVVTLPGCGGVATSPAAQRVGTQLTIYSSLPLQGPSAPISRQIVGGEKLALSDDGGRVGRFVISYVSLDDSGRVTGEWDPGVTAANAKAAAQDTTTIAYLGDYNSGATAISLPLTNAAGILQVSPASPYVGLTSSLDAGQGEPERFYLAGRRTFGRIAPGDPVQAQAQVALMHSLGIRRVYVIADQDPFDAPLAQIVAGDAERSGIRVRAQDTISIGPGSSFSGEVAKVSESGAEAVFLSATATIQAAQLARELHAAVPTLQLLASSATTNEVFTANLGPAAEVTFIGSPVLDEDSYPPPARRVLAHYRERFSAPGGPYVLYGYEAMSSVLAAIRAAGERGDNRLAVIESFMTTRDRDSVLGHYSMQPDGETTLSSYAIDRVVGGVPVFWRSFNAASNGGGASLVPAGAAGSK